MPGVTPTSSVVPPPGQAQRRTPQAQVPGPLSRASQNLPRIPQQGGGVPARGGGIAAGIAGATDIIAEALERKKAFARRQKERDEEKKEKRLVDAENTFAGVRQEFSNAVARLDSDISQLMATQLKAGANLSPETQQDFDRTINALERIKGRVLSKAGKNLELFVGARDRGDIQAVVQLSKNVVDNMNEILQGTYVPNTVEGISQKVDEFTVTNLMSTAFREMNRAGVNAELIAERQKQQKLKSVLKQDQTLKLSAAFLGVPDNEPDTLTDAYDDLGTAVVETFAKFPQLSVAGAVPMLKAILGTYSERTGRLPALSNQLDFLVDQARDNKLNANAPLTTAASAVLSQMAGVFAKIATNDATLDPSIVYGPFDRDGEEQVVTLDVDGIIKKNGELPPDMRSLFLKVSQAAGGIASLIQSQDALKSLAISTSMENRLDRLVNRVKEITSAQRRPASLADYEAAFTSIIAEDPELRAVANSVQDLLPNLAVSLNQFRRVTEDKRPPTPQVAQPPAGPDPFRPVLTGPPAPLPVNQRIGGVAGAPQPQPQP